MKNIAITENHLYNKAYRKGQRFLGKCTAVYVLRDYAADKLRRANPEKRTVNRLGISVSKKNGGAVTRNRIKRLIREGFRAIEREDCLKTGFLVIIAAKNEAAEVKSGDIEKELRYAFRKLDMLKPTKEEAK